MSEQQATKKPNIFRRIINSVWENPIVIKEMRGRMRRRRTYLILTGYLLLVALITSLVYFSFVSSNEIYPDPSVRQTLGKGIFITVVILQATAINFVTPALTAGSISGERERQTYDLLQTTLISAREIVEGKFLSGFLFTMLLLIAVMPLQGIAFLFGGIELPELIVSSLMLVVTATTFSAVGVYFSSLMRRTLPATVLAYTISNILIFGFPLLLVVLLGLFSPLIDRYFYTYSFSGLPADPPALAIQIVLVIIGWFLASSNPAFAAVISELLLLEEDALFVFQIELENNFMFPFVSPWLGYVFIFSLISLLFYRLSIRRTKKIDKR